MADRVSIQGPFGIVGLGLMGGTLAKALRRARPNDVCMAVEPDANTRQMALNDKVVRQAWPTVESSELDRCETIFLCVPLPVVPATLSQLCKKLRPTALLSDVIGVKATVLQQLMQHMPQQRFVGTHPMAGGPSGGYGASRAELFVQAPVAICPKSRSATDQADAAAMVDLWKSFGSSPLLMSADEHDAAVAITSHLPYISAVALTALFEESGASSVPLAGPGLQAAIRQAAFSPDVMASVAHANPALSKLVRQYASQLIDLAEALEDPSPRQLHAQAIAAQHIAREMLK